MSRGKKRIDAGIHRKPVKIDYDAIARECGLEEPKKWAGLPSVETMRSVPGWTKDNPLRDLTLARFLYMVKRYSPVMCSWWIEITPQIAKLVLDHLNVVNRKINQRKRQDFASSMSVGKFFRTTVTVRFDSNGAFIDGQTRLSGIVDSGIPLVMLVGFGESPMVAQLTTDVGSPRTAMQQASIATGKATPSAGTTVARHMFQSSPAFANGKGLTGRRMTTYEVAAAYEDYCCVIDRAIKRVLSDNKPKGLVFPNAVASVIARAYLTQSWDEVDRFCDVISMDGSDMSSMPRESWEMAAVMFRDEIKKEQHVKERHDPEYAWIYRTTEMALWNFIHRVTPKRLEQADGELFPLSETTSLTNDLERSDRVFVEQKKVLVCDVPEGRLVDEKEFSMDSKERA